MALQVVIAKSMSLQKSRHMSHQTQARRVPLAVPSSQEPLQLFNLYESRRQSGGQVWLQRRPLRCHLGCEAIAALVLHSTEVGSCRN